MAFSKWREVKLEDIGEIVGGGTPSTKQEAYYGGDISWITPKDLANYTDRYIYKGDRMITEEGLAGSSAKLLPRNTVLFSSRAPIGYIAIAGKEVCTNQGFKSIIPKPGISDSMFLYYLLMYRKKDIESVASGTTFMEVSGSVLKKFTVLIPDIIEQKAIAAALSCLDDKIELNNRINKNLEEIAQAIFKCWFVDFEPFQDGEFEDSELGMIPKGWNVGTISELLSDTLSGDWGKDEPQGNYIEEVLCIRGADIPEIALGKKGKPPTRYILKKNLETKRLSEGQIIIEISGGSPTQSTGRTALITQGLTSIIDRPIICTNFCRALSMKKVHYSTYVYSLLQYLYKRDILFSFENGTTGIKNLDTSNLFSSYAIVIPTDQEMLNYKKVFDTIINAIYQNGAEAEKLVTIRDTLLPKLMSGEIRVPY